MSEKKILLTEKEIPENWYNIMADMPNKPLPPLNPIVGLQQWAKIAKMEAIAGKNPEVLIPGHGDDSCSLFILSFWEM